MSSRPTDWSALGYSSDPIPGDPSVVSAAAKRYRDIAETISRAHRSLQSISYRSQGHTAQELRNRAEELAVEVNKAHSRCEDAANVLKEYAPCLRQAQRDSVAALNQASPAQDSVRDARRQQISLQTELITCRDPRRMTEISQECQRLGRRKESAQASVNAARAKLKAAIEARDKAATKAVSALQEADKNSPLKDGLWERFREFLQGLRSIAEYVKPFLDWAGIVLAGITVLVAIACPPVGSALLLLGFALTAATTACNLAINTSKLANGEMSVTQYATETALDLGMLALSAVGLRGSLAGAKAGAAARKTAEAAAKKAGAHGVTKKILSGTSRSEVVQAVKGATKGSVDKSGKLVQVMSKANNVVEKIKAPLTAPIEWATEASNHCKVFASARNAAVRDGVAETVKQVAKYSSEGAFDEAKKDWVKNMHNNQYGVEQVGSNYWNRLWNPKPLTPLGQPDRS